VVVLANPTRAAEVRRADRFAFVALGWAVLAGLAFAVLPSGTSSSTTTTSSGTVIETTTDESLLEREGAGILIVLAIPALLALTAVVVKRRSVRLGVGFVFLAACLLGAMSVGLFFLPGAVLVLYAASTSPAALRPT
jgi:hypothetical protein